MAPREKKLNFYRLLRQLESSEEQWEFLRTHKLLPSSIECEKCFKTLTKVYPLSKPDAPFKYFNCKCSKKVKVPITKNTLMFHSNISPRMFLILAYGFAYRWKYSDIRREADVEGTDNSETGTRISDATIAKWLEIFRLCVGQDMVDREGDDKIGGVGK